MDSVAVYLSFVLNAFMGTQKWQVILLAIVDKNFLTKA